MITAYLKQYLVRFFPFVGVFKRATTALRDSISRERSSYSQHGEDQFIYAILQDYNLECGVYVDIGANHPTSISNTYLFYRKGFQGISIEPNPELCQLHRLFRPRDNILNIGCGEQASLGYLKVGKAPVLSHFTKGGETEQDKANLMHESLGFEEWKSLYVPILTLDIILDQIQCEWIYFVSIDVEGLDLEVLEGARNSLSKILICCIEANNETLQEKIHSLLTSEGFILKTTNNCNLIYFNNSQRFNNYRK